ncbi:MAG: immunity 53 family protein [Janthinobacterium lividum]
MDLLQRIQRWYTINCNGDWEHSYGLSVWHGISVQTLDNPGWIVSIDLKDTCLNASALPYVLHERSTVNWFGYKVEKDKFEAVGGPENLTEILTYFLDIFIPEHIDQSSTLELYLPVLGYAEQLWLRAEARMISESTLEIISITDPESSNAISWRSDKELDLLAQPGTSIADLQTNFAVGDWVEPTVFQADDNMLRTFLVAPAKK